MVWIAERPRVTGVVWHVPEVRVEVEVVLDDAVSGDWFGRFEASVGDVPVGWHDGSPSRVNAFLRPGGHLREDLSWLLDGISKASALSKEAEDLAANVDRELEMWWVNNQRD